MWPTFGVCLDLFVISGVVCDTRQCFYTMFKLCTEINEMLVFASKSLTPQRRIS